VPIFSTPALLESPFVQTPLKAEIEAKALTLDKLIVDHPAYGLRVNASRNGEELINRLSKSAPISEMITAIFPVATASVDSPISLTSENSSPSDPKENGKVSKTEQPTAEFSLLENSGELFSTASASDDFFSTAAKEVQTTKPKAESALDTLKDQAAQNETSLQFPFSSAQASQGVGAKPESVTTKATSALEEEEDQKSASAAMTEPKQRPVAPTSEDDDDDDNRDELEQDDLDYAAPPRRSFSDNSRKTKSKAIGRLPASKDLDEVKKVDDEEEREEEGPQIRKQSNLDIAGRQIPRKAVTALACLVGFAIFCNVAASLLNNLFGGQSPANRTVSLSGKWRFAAQCGSAKCAGEMLIHQHDSQISGDGIDNAGGPFKFAGSLKDSQHLELAKRYVRNGQLVGDVTSFHGEIQSDSKPLFISGDFRRDSMVGGKWRGRPMTYTGIWEAEMLQPMAEDANVPSMVAQEAIMAKPSGTASLTQNFAMWAVGALGLVIFTLYSMRALFGPDGLRARWDKEKYIPSQFRGQNKKDVKELSQALAPGSLPLGQREEWKFWHNVMPWVPKYLALPPNLRKKNPHLLILGGGKKGKSRLMANMITHDIEANDRAVVLIDSDGGLADMITRWIAAHPRAKVLSKRVVMIDPSYPGGTNTYNPLVLPSDGNLQSAASSLVFGMKAIYTEAPNSQNAWSAQTADILQNAALLLMVCGKTLTDLTALLTDNDERDKMLAEVERKKTQKVEYQGIADAWGRYRRVARSEQWLNWIEPILNRVSPTLSDPRIRPILTRADGGINLAEIITGKKILIVKIPKAQLHDHANLLGSLIVTGIKQAALSIASKDPAQQRAVALYLDEFDNFIEKETFDAITHETKKFQVGFIGAIKTLQHLPEDFRNQLIINVGTISVFALAKKDGDMLGPQMFRVDGRKKKHETLTNFINPINSSPQFELISDEEKFNIDRILGQAERTFFCYRVGTVAGLFHLRSHPFNDIPDDAVNEKLIEKMHAVKA
jgi:hypothetical protein